MRGTIEREIHTELCDINSPIYLHCLLHRGIYQDSSRQILAHPCVRVLINHIVQNPSILGHIGILQRINGRSNEVEDITKKVIVDLFHHEEFFTLWYGLFNQQIFQATLISIHCFKLSC
ncbi:hypothetical protein FGO68_gene15528 [Halteria grandinella]|uniref:Uncharacterized protein n=1 Tax=Halteria grandinella TaxID=5974 RepID=A0A8J8P0V1_HALGN|nr:hypothetical protein FGO68_gene15528 [Halteria grandinella]